MCFSFPWLDDWGSHWGKTEDVIAVRDCHSILRTHFSLFLNTSSVNGFTYDHYLRNTQWILTLQPQNWPFLFTFLLPRLNGNNLGYCVLVFIQWTKFPLVFIALYELTSTLSPSLTPCNPLSLEVKICYLGLFLVYRLALLSRSQLR